MLIRCENVICGYGRTPSENPVLNGINLDIEEGKSYCILGANGCGKTTLLRALSGMLPYEGSISLEDIKKCAYRMVRSILRSGKYTE